MIDSLVEDGHNPQEVHAALSIVDNIRRHLDAPGSALRLPKSDRLFMQMEEYHLPPEVRGYLNQLMTLQVIDPIQREDLVERLMVLDPDELTLEEVESVLDETLSNRPGIPGHFDETVSDYYH
jgi:Smg protein